MNIRRVVEANVRGLREDRGWLQEQLAFECGLHRTYFSGVQRGIRNPTSLVLQEITSALAVPTAKLLEAKRR